eukprot:m.328272 g.328272  ORF g.328272 m.328272 type:complete len:645 (-) comp27687_c0_seq8:4188-6122(-)
MRWCALLIATVAAALGGSSDAQPPPPPPEGTFESSVMLVTQLSLDHAPQKYPELGRQMSDAAANVEAQRMAFKDSGNLQSCGNASHPANKWLLYLNETQKHVVYLNTTLSAQILPHGLRVAASVNTSFACPVWLGACAWSAALQKPPSPRIVSVALDTIHTVTQRMESQIKSELHDEGGQTGGCTKPPKIYYNFAGTSASVSVTFDDSTLSFSSPSADFNGYLVEGDIKVSVRVPVSLTIKAALFCTGVHRCSGSASISGRAHVSIKVNCVSCAIRGGESSVKFTPTVDITSYTPDSSCGGTYFQKYFGDLESSIQNYLLAQLALTLNGLNEAQLRTSCGCVEVCPMPSSLNGSFTTDVQTTLTVADPARKLVVTGNDTVATVPNASVNLHVCGPSADFYGQWPFIESSVVSALQTAVSRNMADEARSFNVPVVVQPFPQRPIFYSYSLENVSFVANQNITASSTAVLYATVDGRNHSFVDYDAAEAHVLPPVYQPWIPTMGQLPINAVRVSTTALNGLANLANLLGYFREGLDVTILDAHLRFNATFAEPAFSVPSDGVLQLNLPRGELSVTCLNTCGANSSTSFGNMMQLRFENITAFNTVSVVQNATNVLSHRSRALTLATRESNFFTRNFRCRRHLYNGC